MQREIGCLGGRDGSAGVVVHDAGDDGLEGGALITAPNEVVAGEFDEELVFAGSYGRRGVGGRVGDGLVGGGGWCLRLNGLVDCEYEENEYERGDQLQKGGSLVPPWQ